jgi:ATP-dependent helicase HepA
MVRGAVDLVLGSGEGTVGFVEWREAPGRGFALDVIFVLEATAPGHLHLDRFLAPSPIRVLVDAAGEDISGLLPRMDIAELEQAPTGLLEEHHAQFDKLVPKLLEAAVRQAGFKETSIKKEAHREAEKRLGTERDRLRDLAAVNPAVKAADVQAAEKLLKDVTGHIMAAELRVDAVRLVILGKMQVG